MAENSTVAVLPLSLGEPMRLRLTTVLLVLLGLQGLLAVVVYIRGFPFFGSSLIPNAPLWEVAVALFHLPAIEALSAVGLCCGFRNGLVLTHVVRGGHVPMDVSGTALLALANWACWATVIGLGWFAWKRRRNNAAPPPPPAAAEA